MKPTSRIITVIAAVLSGVAAFAAAPAGAIIGGTPDDIHTNVGVVWFTSTTFAGEKRLDCSGTLISPTVVLTSGHCTKRFVNQEPVGDVCVSFDYAQLADPLNPNVSEEERAARQARCITGTPYADPAWNIRDCLQCYDHGVVVLDAPATSKWPDITPAPLAPVGTLDGNLGQLKQATFTLVGYGSVYSDPHGNRVDTDVRRSAVAPLQHVDDFAAWFQTNAHDANGDGGSCIGDSGGPAFMGPYVVGNSSVVESYSCTGFAGYSRIDTVHARAFLDRFLQP